MGQGQSSVSYVLEPQSIAVEVFEQNICEIITLSVGVYLVVSQEDIVVLNALSLC